MVSQAPDSKERVIFDKSIWNAYHAIVDELNLITGDNYDRHKVELQPWETSNEEVALSVLEYRTKVIGLVGRLYATFFFGDPEPFSGSPSTVFNNQQTQNQTLDVQIRVDIESKIDEILSTLKEGSKEKNFLDKVKSSLSQVKSVSDLIRLILQTGNDMGVTLAQALKLFG